MLNISKILKFLSLDRPVQPWLFHLGFAVFLAGPSNYPLWRYLLGLYPISTDGSLFFLIVSFVFLTSFFYSVMIILSVMRLDKFVAIAVVLINSIALYFMDRFSVIIDSTMIDNVLQTDVAEATEVAGALILLYVALGGILPAWILYKTPVDYPKTTNGKLFSLKTIIIPFALINFIAATQFQSFASLVRNHKEVRYHILPNSYVSAVTKVTKRHLFPEQKHESILIDAKKESSWSQHQKKTLFVLVVGETARAKNFSLNGYERQTNPLLEKEKIVNFTNVRSCGTNTAFSLPCMFSPEGRATFDISKKDEPNNMIRLMKRAGFKTAWIDNNSGCKGVCTDIETLNTKDLDEKYNTAKDGREVYDMSMIKALDDILKKDKQDSFIVLHQKGSHGPAYYLRTPEQFQKFKPMCKTNELMKCSQEEIVNSYDNTILYTDYFLASLINHLKSLSKEYNTAMIYVSDHGESLGEKNLYLHGFPYMIAPEEQKHVPMITWLSDGFSVQQKIETSCLVNKNDDDLSHDNLFHSVLDILDIQSPLKKNDLSIFNSCRGIHDRSAQAF